MLENLQKKANLASMKTFTLTYDRHKGMYGQRLRNFPEEYPHGTSVLEFIGDPDWTVKLALRRFPVRKYLLGALILYLLFKQRLHSVAQFDAMKRQEQRAMQNKEVDEVFNKKVRFCLFSYDQKTQEYKQLTHRNIADLTHGRAAGAYSILWYDAKMQNFLNLLEYLNKKRLTNARVNCFLIVDRPEYVENVQKIKDAASNKKLRDQLQVALKRDLTDQESLMHSFSDETPGEESEDATIDLDLKKNFFYVINPEGRIIDCAKIYSFLHENNIY